MKTVLAAWFAAGVLVLCAESLEAPPPASAFAASPADADAEANLAAEAQARAPEYLAPDQTVATSP